MAIGEKYRGLKVTIVIFIHQCLQRIGIHVQILFKGGHLLTGKDRPESLMFQNLLAI